MSILDELDEMVKASKPPSHSLIAKAVRRMKRDRRTINRMQGYLNWYEDKVRALEAQLSREDGGSNAP